LLLREAGACSAAIVVIVDRLEAYLTANLTGWKPIPHGSLSHGEGIAAGDAVLLAIAS
jgi:hypothetical protein